MQDFIKQPKPASTQVKPAAITKQTSWLTKNRFWNFVFWIGMSLGLTLGSFAMFTLEMPNLASAINWTTLLGIPLLVVLANRTRFSGKDTFANSENIELTKKQMPTGNFIWLTILGIGFTFIVAETILSKEVDSVFNSLIFFTCLFSGFSLYFIFKNCPVSILFNRKCWHYLADNAPTRPRRPSGSNRSPSSPTPFNVMMNPMYKNRSSNIYHRNR